MIFNQLLPFIVYAAIKKRRIEALKKINEKKRLIKSKLIDETKVNNLNETWQVTKDQLVNVIHVVPNDVYFLQDDSDKIDFDKQIALVTEIDYSDVANRIELFFNNEVAGYKLGNGLYNFSNILTSKYIDDAKRGLATQNLDDLREGDVMTESVRNPRTSKLYARVATSNNALSTNLPEFVRAVKAYLMSNSLTSQIPMLIGFSGVAKSAIIKSLTDELDRYYQSEAFKNSTLLDNKEYSSINGTVSLTLSDKDKSAYLGFSSNSKSRITEFDKLDTFAVNKMINDYNMSLMDSDGLNKIHNRNFRIVADNEHIFIDTTGKSFMEESSFIDSKDKLIDDLVKVTLVKEFIEPEKIATDAAVFDSMVVSGEITKQARDQFAFEQFKDLRQYGMRMIDVRCAFLSPFDLEGLNIIKDSEIGDPVGMSAPFDKFMLCTDEFIYFARNMIAKISSVLEQGVVNNHKLTITEVSQLSQALERCKYYAKIPVLFFDEITRSDRGIQGALTTIINQRRFLGRYNMKLARMVSATNAPVGRGYENDDDLSNFFVKTRMNDKAMLDRFIRYRVSPEDVYLHWLRWAEGEGHIHSRVIEYIKNNGQSEIAYNVETAVQKAKNGEIDDMIPAYPTYRAWTMVSDYLKNYEQRRKNNSGTIFNKSIIEGTLGVEVDNDGNKYGVSVDFCNWLEDIGFITPADEIPVNSDGVRVSHPYTADDGDVMAQVMEDALEAGLPVMLMGVSGLGKTQRVIDYKNRHNYNLFEVNLASKERFDILGASASVNILNYIAREFSSIFSELGIEQELIDSLNEVGISHFLTVRAPKAELRNELQKTLQQGNKLILYFDEFNRALDQKCQSAIFEAISDSRLLGVTFPKDLVKIVLTGNIGNQYEDTRKIDPALPARCVQVFIHDYTDVEAKNVIKRWYRDGYNSYILRYLESLTSEERIATVKRLLSAVDQAELLNNVSSSRLMKEFSDKLNEGLNLGVGNLTGSVLLPNEDDRSDFWLASDDDKYLITLNTAVIMSKHFYNWGAKLAGFLFDENDPNFSIDEAIEEFTSDILPNLKSEDVRLAMDINYIEGNSHLSEEDIQSCREFFNFARKVIERFVIIDEELIDSRNKAIEPYLGKELSAKFVEWLNINSGRSTMDIVTFDDLADDSRVADFAKMCFAKENHQWHKYIREVYDYWKTDLKIETYMKLISEFIRMDINSNSLSNSLQALLDITDDDKLNSIILKLENLPYKNSYIESIINLLGFSKTEFEHFAITSDVGSIIEGFYDRY